jgi:hypothetical protein
LRHSGEQIRPGLGEYQAAARWVQDQPTMGDSGNHRRAVFRRGAARISALRIDISPTGTRPA